MSALSSHASIPSALLNTLKPSRSKSLANFTSLSQNNTKSGLDAQSVSCGFAGRIESNWSLGIFLNFIPSFSAASISQRYISSNFSLFKYPFTTNQPCIQTLPSSISISTFSHYSKERLGPPCLNRSGLKNMLVYL